MNDDRIEPQSLADLAARMRPRQFQFCVEYLACSSSLDAYKRAYGDHSSDSSRQAYKVRHAPLVEEFISLANELRWANWRDEEIKAQAGRETVYSRWLSSTLRSGRRKP